MTTRRKSEDEPTESYPDTRPDTEPAAEAPKPTRSVEEIQAEIMRTPAQQLGPLEAELAAAKAAAEPKKPDDA